MVWHICPLSRFGFTNSNVGADSSSEFKLLEKFVTRVSKDSIASRAPWYGISAPPRPPRADLASQTAKSVPIVRQNFKLLGKLVTHTFTEVNGVKSSMRWHICPSEELDCYEQYMPLKGVAVKNTLKELSARPFQPNEFTINTSNIRRKGSLGPGKKSS